MAKHTLKNGTQTLPGKTTKPGTPPNQSKKLPVIGSGRNRPAKGYVNGQWQN